MPVFYNAGKAYTQDDFQTYLTACNTAITAGDYAAARTAAVQAQVVLAGLADYSDGDRSLKNKELVDNILTNLDTLESKSAASRTNARVLAQYRRT